MPAEHCVFRWDMIDLISSALGEIHVLKAGLLYDYVCHVRSTRETKGTVVTGDEKVKKSEWSSKDGIIFTDILGNERQLPY